VRISRHMRAALVTTRPSTSGYPPSWERGRLARIAPRNSR